MHVSVRLISCFCTAVHSDATLLMMNAFIVGNVNDKNWDNMGFYSVIILQTNMQIMVIGTMMMMMEMMVTVMMSTMITLETMMMSGKVWGR